jgi:hypothetical protein
MIQERELEAYILSRVLQALHAVVASTTVERTSSEREELITLRMS